MTFTTAQAFTAFLDDSVSPTAAQRVDVTTKRAKTEDYLRDAFPPASTLPLKRVVLIGSADRGTLIRPVDDVDVLAEFTNKDKIFETYRHDSGAFLQLIRRALNANTSIKRIGARGQAVRLFYTGGAHVDIAAVFKWSGSGFALPSGDGGWITTDPEEQARWFTGRKATVGASLSTVVKLAKRWNDVHSKRLASYHLEVVVANAFASVSTNYRNAMKCFFEWAPDRLDVNDPAGHSGILSAYLTYTERVALRSRFAEALGRAQRALDAEASGNHAEAKRLWRIEMGTGFPTS